MTFPNLWAFIGFGCGLGLSFGMISLVVVPTQDVVDSGLCCKTDLMSDDTHYSVRGISETATVFK